MIAVIHCTSAAAVMEQAAHARAYRRMVFARPHHEPPPAPVKPIRPNLPYLPPVPIKPRADHGPRIAGHNNRRIVDACAMHFGVTVDEIRGTSRLAHITRARHVAAWLLRKMRSHSFPEIARILQRGDHTTILSACRKIEGNPELLAFAETIRQALEEAAHG